MQLTSGVFVNDEQLLDVSFTAAQARLANLIRSGCAGKLPARAGLFPALDADITLTPAGEDATVLRLAGAYRPPLGPPRRQPRPGDLAPGSRRDDPGLHQPHRHSHRPPC
jgi:hypothetical protein